MFYAMFFTPDHLPMFARQDHPFDVCTLLCSTCFWGFGGRYIQHGLLRAACPAGQAGTPYMPVTPDDLNPAAFPRLRCKGCQAALEVA